MTGPVSFAVLEGAQSLHRARMGDISVLLERLRSTSELLDEERQFLADLIEGKHRLPQNRPAKLETELRDLEMIETFLLERAIFHEPKTAERVAYRFGVSTRHLHRRHNQFRNSPREYEGITRRVARQLEAYERLEVAHLRARRADIQERWNERRKRRLLNVPRSPDDTNSGV